MSEAFVDLVADRAALTEVLAQLGLAQRDEPIEVTPLTGGVSSSIFRLDLRSGRWCVKQALPKLKVASDWRAPVTRVFAEIDWLAQVARWHPDHVPEVVAVHRDSGAFVMPFLDPARWQNWKERLLAGVVDERTASCAGAVLADIHARSASMPELAARFANADNFLALRLDPYLLETARRTPDLAARLESIVATTQAQAKALVHGDVSPKNILVDRADPQRFVLLDAECATWGDPAFDLAFLLNHFVLKSIHLPERRGPLLGAFDAAWTAYRAGVRWETPSALEARAAALLSGLFLARIDGKSPVEYLSAESRAHARSLARGCLTDGVDSLAEIARRARGAQATR